jgi:ubiquitin-conjugating enzyme E2 D/E
MYNFSLFFLTVTILFYLFYIHIFFLYYSYPMRPPKVQFITKIFHPNISRHGDVGLDSIHYNWSLALTISKVLISIQSLLTDPYCDVCMEPAIGSLYSKNRQEFERISRLWTWKYAMHDFLMPMEIDLNGL